MKDQANRWVQWTHLTVKNYGKVSVNDTFALENKLPKETKLSTI